MANYNDVDTAEDAVVDYNWGGTTYAAGYQAVARDRVLDTRKGTGEMGGKAAQVPGGGTPALNVAAPAGTTAVVMNLTVTDDPVGGYITAYPYGEQRPATSSLNFAANETLPNTVVVPVGSNATPSCTTTARSRSTWSPTSRATSQARRPAPSCP